MADYKPEILRTRVRGGILVIIDNALRQNANQRVILPYHNGITAEALDKRIARIAQGNSRNHLSAVFHGEIIYGV